MNNTPILDAPWPPDLNPATVPFLTRSVTILRRMGFLDDPSRFNTLTEAEVLSWWYAGVGIVADIRTTGNAAIVEYHGASQAGESWAVHIWDRDPRFSEYLPKGGGTVYGVVTSGTDDDRQCLWDNLDALREAVAAQDELTVREELSGNLCRCTGYEKILAAVNLAAAKIGGSE